MEATLPIFELVINTDETSDVEVSFVALVDKPAIERNFLAFNDNRLSFAVNDEKHIISGPAMVPGQMIYRKDDTGEYYVYFSAETIRDIVIKFFKKDYQKNLNLFHDPALSVDGITIFESFVSDAARGVAGMKGFDDLPDGTWFISAKVENEPVWQKVKSGEIKGFSVEGIFSYLRKKRINDTQFADFHLNEETHIMADIKELWDKFKEKFLGDPTPQNPQPVNMATEYTLKDGTKCMIDKVEPGGIVLVNEAPAPAGEMELEDGSVIVVGEAGVITEVKPKMEAPAPDFGEQFKAYDEKLKGYEASFATHTAAFEAMAGEYAKTKQQLSELVEIVAKIVETPTAESVVQPSQFSKKENARQELITRFQNLKRK